MLILSIVTLCALVGGQVAIAQDPEQEVIYYDYIDDDGVLKGGVLVVDVNDPLHSEYKDPNAVFPESYPTYNVNTIIYNGDPNNRVDLVILGDGYDVNDINDGLYATHVNSVVEGFFAELPLDEYASFFNVHRVDVISNESGVDYDPCGPFSPDPTLKDTALDMGFWSMYQGKRMERLLTIGNTEAAKAAVNQDDVPDCNQILALANSTKYGGSGGVFICLAGGNEWVVDIGLHECGHSFAKLGDEYFDPNGVEYTDPETSLNGIGNLSTLYANDMNTLETKWYRWLEFGVNEPNVWTFKGAFVDYNSGIYRPTDWSKMRSLRYEPNHPDYPNEIPFFQVNVEQFVLKIYEMVNPIDDATPPGTYPVGVASTVFFVEPVQPATHNLNVQWYLDGNSITGATGTMLDVSCLYISPGEHTLDVNVIDKTELVRDEDERDRLMSDSRTWTLMKRALVGYWKLDETSGIIAADSSIYDNNGILNNMDPNNDWVTGKINGALDFDGENDYVSLYPIPVLAGDNVTVSAWIKADDVNEGLHPIFSQYEYDPLGGNYYGYLLYLSGSQPRFFLGGAGRAEALDVTVNNMDWYHFTGTNDGENLKIYVNGEPKGSISSYGYTGVHLDAYIGCDGDDDYFTGKIDDVRVYNWALDANEVWKLSYESDADFNGDDIVNFLDYAMFANAWQSDNYEFSLDYDNYVDMNDLAIFCEDWLWQAGGAMLMGQSMGQGMGKSLCLEGGFYIAETAKQVESQVTEADIEELIRWLSELWLTDDELRKMISEDDWQKFIESVSESM